MSKFIIMVASMGMIGFLFLGLTWGEGLLHQEWISRFDYLIILFSGFGTAMCLSVLMFVEVEESRLREIERDFENYIDKEELS